MNTTTTTPTRVERQEQFMQDIKTNGVTVIVHDLNQEYALEQLLPKGWAISDYDNVEHIFEIEHDGGDRFWIKPFDLFHKHLELGCKIKLLLIKDGKFSYAQSSLVRFDTAIKRKRTYLLAFIAPVDEAEFIENFPTPIS